jgi:hypothetical protein
MRPISHALVLAVVGVAALSSCRPSDRDATAGATAAPADTAASMGEMGAAMADSMHAHMQHMETMTGDQMKAMLPEHRQMAANMLSRMSSEMRSMNMSADAAWNATADSLRQDLARMPDMSAQQLKSMMAGHHGRIMRLLGMHGSMMGTKKP